MNTTNTAKIIDAATAEAARLSDRALSACARYRATPAKVDSARRAQIAEFRNARKSERVVCDMLRGEDDRVNVDSREELLEAVALYIETGVVEVCRRFGM